MYINEKVLFFVVMGVILLVIRLVIHLLRRDDMVTRLSVLLKDAQDRGHEYYGWFADERMKVQHLNARILQLHGEVDIVENHLPGTDSEKLAQVIRLAKRTATIMERK